MASPAVAIPLVNGANVRSESPLSINSSTKRKRDASDDGDAEVKPTPSIKAVVNGKHSPGNHKALIREFFGALQRYARPMRNLHGRLHGCRITVQARR